MRGKPTDYVGLTYASEEGLFSDEADAMTEPDFHGCAEGLDTSCTEVESAALRAPYTVDKLVLAQDRNIEAFTQGGGKRRFSRTGPADPLRTSRYCSDGSATRYRLPYRYRRKPADESR